jgi:hypothetical protein
MSHYKTEQYMNDLILKNEKLQNIQNKKLGKLPNDEFSIITIHNYQNIITYNYNVSQLKQIAKFYRLKISGNKKELSNRIYCFLYFSLYIIKLQKIYRGHLVRKFNKCFGPALYKTSMCTNNTDFITLDELENLKYPQFFSYKDNDGTIYGFDISSLYNQMFKINKTDSKNANMNPYNRQKIPTDVVVNLQRIIRLSKLLKIKVSLALDTDVGDITDEKNIELKTLALFQAIDLLGNYSSPNWFLSLSRQELIRLVRELNDIWCFRAQLSLSTKMNICPPRGNPFLGINMNIFLNTTNELTLKKYVLEILEKLVYSGIDTDSKSLGSYYVLGALTLVNQTAANSLPWLYQSFAYHN